MNGNARNLSSFVGADRFHRPAAFAFRSGGLQAGCFPPGLADGPRVPPPCISTRRAVRKSNAVFGRGSVETFLVVTRGFKIQADPFPPFSLIFLDFQLTFRYTRLLGLEGQPDNSRGEVYRRHLGGFLLLGGLRVQRLNRRYRSAL
jgi:hypothetical protein